MRKATCFFLAATTVACFDVETIDPCAATEPFLVDDFEDEDTVASQPFQRWSCSGFNPDDNEEFVNACDLTAGANGGTGFFGDFLLTDPPNDNQEFTGARLSTISTRTFDLGCYRELRLNAKFVAGREPPPAGSRFYAELTCQSAGSGGEVGVLREITLTTSSWHDFQLPLRVFRQPTWQLDTIDGGEEACLARIDGVGLLLSTNLADGESGGGTLYIDNVSFE
jgi:hypothetical protein